MRSSLIIRPRVAPPVNPGIGLKGWMYWQKIDKYGKEVAAGEQANLILDVGLDQIGSAGLIDLGRYMTVGTGSTAPDPTQTSLSNEVARTQRGGTSLTRTADGVYERSYNYEFGYAEANGNLTEWGGATDDIGNQFSRELFRDGSDNPITVTKTSDELLRITYIIEIQLTPVTTTAGSIVVNNLGTLNGVHTFMGEEGGLDYNTVDKFIQGIEGSDYAVPFAHRDSNFIQLLNYSGGIDLNDNGYTGALDDSKVYKAYVSGSHEKLQDWIIPTGQANYKIASFAFCERRLSYNQAYPDNVGWIFVIDEADRPTKNSLHRLELYDFKMSWARST